MNIFSTAIAVLAGHGNGIAVIGGLQMTFVNLKFSQILHVTIWEWQEIGMAPKEHDLVLIDFRKNLDFSTFCENERKLFLGGEN
jgi:hypothetical protein